MNGIVGTDENDRYYYIEGDEEIMRIREIVVRLGYTLLGSLLTLCIVLIHDEYVAANASEELVLVEEMPIEAEATIALPTEESKEESAGFDFEAEAAEKLEQMKAEAEQKKIEQLKLEEEQKAEAEALALETVSANSIEAAPVKWIKDYPQINSDKPLEEKELERSSYEETLAVNAFDKKVIENSTIDFSDVKITILGDSLTQGSNLDEEDRDKYSYPAILQEILGCKEIVNLGIGGSTISALGDNAMVERWSDIPKDSDIIIVFGGSNDMLFEDKWDYGFLEYNNRMHGDTFCGDLDTLMSKIEYVYRDHNEDNYCKLICINPPSTILSTAFYNIDPGNLVHQKEFAKAINQVASEYSFEVIDFYNNNILNTHDRDVNEQFMPDGIHGNEEGYRIMAEHIASQIIQRIEQ